MALAASSRSGGAPEQLRDYREAREARVDDGGGDRLRLGFGGAVARAARDLRVGFRGGGGGLNIGVRVTRRRWRGAVGCGQDS
jgi:hypothetical protein